MIIEILVVNAVSVHPNHRVLLRLISFALLPIHLLGFFRIKRVKILGTSVVINKIL